MLRAQVLCFYVPVCPNMALDSYYQTSFGPRYFFLFSLKMVWERELQVT